MPAKNRIKTYVENGHYHVYNRGVEKRDIFLDDQDYRVFLHLLKTYLSPPPKDISHPLTVVTGFKPVKLRLLTNAADKVSLIGYCLMPNHFHFLLKQIPKNGMTELIRALSTSYVMYFNKKYNRVGHLFQGAYKAVYVDTDNYLLQLSRYIHANPLEIGTGSGTGSDPVQWPYSSYKYFLGLKKAKWVNPQPILAFFQNAGPLYNKTLSYRDFVGNYLKEKEQIKNIKRLLIDE